MPKTQEELTQLKVEYETLNKKLSELTEEELKLVVGGFAKGPESYGMTDNMKNNEIDKSGASIVHRKCF